jgi:hypothetical protein
MSGLLVIDAVGWRSMYFVVMPRVNLIVILVTYARYPFTRTVYFLAYYYCFPLDTLNPLFTANQ